MAELINIPEAARKMHVSRQTIYTWIGKGKIKAVRISGGKYRIPAQQLTRRVSKPQTKCIAVKGRGRPMSDNNAPQAEKVKTRLNLLPNSNCPTSWKRLAKEHFEQR